jgi:heptosyltransferase II
MGKAAVEVNRILVHSTNWIGDAIMTTPAIASLKARFPNAEVNIFARPWVAPVFERNPHVANIFTLDPRSVRGVFGWFKLARRLLTMENARGHDLSILFPNSIRSALEARLLCSKRILGYSGEMRGVFLTDHLKRRKEAREVHEVFYYLWLLDGLIESPPKQTPEPMLEPASKPSVKPLAKPRLELWVTEEEKLASLDLLPGDWRDRKKLIALNPGATFGSAKRWLPERFAKLGDRLLSEEDVRIVILGGPSEKQEADSILASMKNKEKAISLAGKTSLRQLFALVSNLALLVTNDSGTMHVGAALSVPLVAIFGPTDVKTTAPFSERAMIVRNAPPCSPCLERSCPLGHHDCMKNVSVESVYRAARDMLGRYHG